VTGLKSPFPKGGFRGIFNRVHLNPPCPPLQKGGMSLSELTPMGEIRGPVFDKILRCGLDTGFRRYDGAFGGQRIEGSYTKHSGRASQTRRQRPAPPDGCTTSRKFFPCAGRTGLGAAGFTLVELMVVTGILAILASVATPAYINHKNRAIQSEAIEALLRARMDQEIFWAENGFYTNNIRRLPSFGNTAGTSISTPNGYTVRVAWVSANGNSYRIVATKTYFSYAQPDTIRITEDPQQAPIIHNTDALKFSIFRWLFD
jgi:type IV pilus assembly protein PilE